MAEIKLNIYSKENKNEIEKTYATDSIDLMFGTVEDILNVIDLDKLDDEKAIAVMIVKGWRQLKPFLKDIFEGLTDDEMTRIKIKEMIPLFSNIFRGIAENLNILSNGKN
ncbi:MAG: hypothetical protein IKP06_07705 [Elusimicrobiaceae bacterium]|nr:hypothetical protein [Elusimicrobiaceae bacterium]